eukprot:gb/GECG01008980.1/.p1 GENE.gb/GECG01008980.1/~~gb/GECG01008980.1/.p1  ORF type:complete len:686 (+),score=158.53 gb/GECG01008980.1/:1-2058(+)
MANEIQYIVEKLNEPPFERNLSLVSFDEHSPTELVQLLNDVLAELDSSHRIDVRDEGSPEATGERMLQFLRVLRYQIPSTNVDQFRYDLGSGNRNVIYPVLYYLLSKLETLKKRAYVAKFLLNIEIPPEFMHEQVVQEVYQQFKELQVEFKETHKEVERLRAATDHPSVRKRDIAQLEEEKSQLVEKIDQLKKKTKDLEGFEPLREATSRLRKEQEEESRLQDRLGEQKSALQAAETRYNETSRRLAETRANTQDDISAEKMFEMTKKEAEDNEDLVKRRLPETIQARKETLRKLQQSLQEPAKSDREVSTLRQNVQSLESRVENMQKELTEKHSGSQDSKLAMFQRQSGMVAKKKQEKQEEAEKLRSEYEQLNREVESKEAKMSELAGPRYMRKEEFQAYAGKLREKTNEYKALKQQLADIRQETVVLARTEQLLKNRAENLDQFLEDLEARRGVTGYTGVQANLEKVSKAKAQVDSTKGKTLNEISKIVSNINTTLREKKEKLQPLINELKELRSQYTEVESRYMKAKNKFDNTRAGLDTERISLERQCDQLQSEMIEEESRYHELKMQIEFAQDRLARAEQEKQYEQGEGRLLRDFATWHDLFENKIAQQEQLAKTLRAQQKDIKDNAGQHAVQRVKFMELKKLLEMKHNIHEQEAKAEDEDNIPGRYDAVGGANVMTIDQS